MGLKVADALAKLWTLRPPLTMGSGAVQISLDMLFRIH
jgi:hypothetical protein